MKNDVEVIQHIKPSFNNFEYQIIHCQFQRSTYLVVSLYHPPVHDYEEKDLINDISQNIMVITEEIRNNYILVITGDANRLDLSTFTEELQLTNIVREPTRGDRSLDVLLTKRPRYYSVEVFSLTVQTDHQSFFAKPTQLHIVPPFKRTHHFLDRRPQNKEAILKTNLAEILEQDLDNVYTQFTENVLAEIQKNIPVIKVNMSERDPQYVSPLIKTLL